MLRKKKITKILDLVVADSSPIISFARAKKLHLIKELLGKVIIPPEVYNEIVVRGKGKPGAREVERAKWIKVKKLKDQAEAEKFKERLGPGEAEVIVLAQELKLPLLADEWGVIKQARKIGIETTSTHLILVEAKKKNLIKNVKAELDELIVAGFRTTAELVKETLERAGE